MHLSVKVLQVREHSEISETLITYWQMWRHSLALMRLIFTQRKESSSICIERGTMNTNNVQFKLSSQTMSMAVPAAEVGFFTFLLPQLKMMNKMCHSDSTNTACFQRLSKLYCLEQIFLKCNLTKVPNCCRRGSFTVWPLTNVTK